MSPGIEERNPYLVFYPLHVWNKVSAQIGNFRNLKDDIMAERKLKKHFFGNTHQVEIDGNGRVLLPSALKNYARLDRKVSLVGMKEYIELWNEELWRTSFRQEELFAVIEKGAKQGIRFY